MFIKRKKDRSGTTSIVVAEKMKGEYSELATIGIAKTNDGIGALVQKVVNGLIGSGNGDSRVLTCSGKNAKDVRQNG